MKLFFVSFEILLILFSFSLARPTDSFPPDHFMAGWKKSGPITRYSPDNLFNRIDGGAEIFLEFGFKRLEIQLYHRESDEISVEIYWMESPTSASGIFLMKRGKELSTPKQKLRYAGDRFQLMFVKANAFGLINNFSGKRRFFPVMQALLQQITAKIEDGVPVTILRLLPAENKIPDSEKIFRGPYALQSVYTFGEGDIFNLQRKTFGVLANYRSSNKHIYKQLIIRYPDADAALGVFQNLVKSLDSYLTIIKTEPRRFIFRDYKNQYGVISCNDSRLHIQIHLMNVPE